MNWLSRDPIEEQGGLNLYGFAGNDGVNGWDYSGWARLGYRPLTDGEAPIVTAPEGSIADIYNFEINHEQFFFDDGLDLFGNPVPSELANVGYGPVGNVVQFPDSGAFSEDSSTRNYRYLKDYFDDNLLRIALINILKSGNWKADQYDVIWDWDNISKKKCQDFTKAVRMEYARLRQIIELQWALQDILDHKMNGGRNPPSFRPRY